MQQHIALSELTTLWIEDGDEIEQTETWEYLKQKFDQKHFEKHFENL